MLLSPRRGRRVQLRRAVIVLGHASSITEQVAQGGLRMSVTLFGSPPVQFRCPLVALGQALPVAAQAAPKDLRVSMSLGCGLLEQLRRSVVALVHALAIPVQRPGRPAYERYLDSQPARTAPLPARSFGVRPGR